MGPEEQAATGTAGAGERDSIWRGVVLVVLGALVLCWMGFYHCFPILSADTGSHLAMGYESTLYPGRSSVYGLFIRFVSQGELLYLVILVQGLLVSYLLYLHFRSFFRSRLWRYGFLSFVLLVSLTTAASFHVSHFLPDVFTATLFLSITWLLFAGQASTSERIAVSSIFVFSLSTQISHLLIVPVSSAFVLLACLSRRVRSSLLDGVGKRWLLVAAMFGVGLVSIPSVHYLASGRFAITHGTSVYLVNRLLENGTLDGYLRERCRVEKYELCRYRDAIPDNFLWDWRNSPLYKMGGWEAAEEDCGAIVWDVTLTPRYAWKNLLAAVEQSLVQLFSMDMRDAGMGEYTWTMMKKHLGRHVRKSNFAHCVCRLPDLDSLNDSQRAVVFLSILLIAIAFSHAGLRKRIPADVAGLSWLMLSLWAANAFVCGAFAGVEERNQSRVAWLIVLPVFSIFFHRPVWAFIRRSWKGE
ncbi:MAG: hypothetical protein JXR96_04400 [Deltaproteobacteria bacterium]|nr:hypothetical protein [Deltaproteobacteria bacterium]